MTADFSIKVDPTRSLVTITIAGFFQLADVERFGAARNVAHERLRCGPNRHDTIVDMRGMKIQTKDCVDAFGRLLNDRTHASRRLVFVVSAGLARAQIQRAATGRDALFFADVGEAELWLQGQGEEVRTWRGPAAMAAAAVGGRAHVRDRH